ncbi:amino acid ABC transporter permease [Aerococcus sanguinicola]|uniref:amino acid ABC transporter permease n=1 Tax=unclassified Aerococcus TaxID=2618060 RepID=UPI0008A37A15|nr:MULTISPECIES: amino acid ABC transporter permease [unclassified Aerococcus]KAB0645290.1 amino acid ABC transporter permease [Aerococcus sanguinicola]MDK6234361.1 amino acid ABC transporter permease [Aerococcus sp. UMB10185]MDK6856194.1 amino acid ABC transporter permease [Aerococcus sp. UMB7533]OFN05367.1 glutamine ABC transporter permease [Aerococcus sp. HMSC062A02]OHO43951.1 glutamine ABC transporter permease [Aerococcus sp. HMSC035B07]
MDFSGAFQWININFLLQGLWVTVKLTLLTISLSLFFGSLLGILRYLKLPIISNTLGFLIDTVRNLPLLLIIFFTYFALPQIGIKMDIFWAAVAALTLFESAMISEIIRAGILALPKGQFEAGLATGLSRSQTMAYIIMPQVYRTMAPSIVSQLIALIKDTSLATIISLPELMHNARIIYGQNSSYILGTFALVTIMYWLICYTLSQTTQYLNKGVSKSA